jgi:hypothetical protein
MDARLSKARKLRKKAKQCAKLQMGVRATDDESLRTVKRPRRYVAKNWLVLLTPLFGYNHSRDAYVLRVVGRHLGPVLRPDRRVRRERPSEGADRRRRASLA